MIRADSMAIDLRVEESDVAGGKEGMRAHKEEHSVSS